MLTDPASVRSGTKNGAIRMKSVVCGRSRCTSPGGQTWQATKIAA
jgi:hypothetical protein